MAVKNSVRLPTAKHVKHCANPPCFDSLAAKIDRLSKLLTEHLEKIERQIDRLVYVQRCAEDDGAGAPPDPATLN
jgi:hypothetical protein